MTGLTDPLATVEALPDSRLIIWSTEEGMRLYKKGFFGKPLGVPKPKEEFDAPLILDPIEGFYLLERGMITVISGKEKKPIPLKELGRIARRTLERFDELYKVYVDLREKSLIVTPGIKYGCDFAVYKRGPGIDHAPFVVQVMNAVEGLSALQIVKAGRLATTVRKTFIIAMLSEKEVKYLSFKWWKP